MHPHPFIGGRPPYNQLCPQTREGYEEAVKEYSQAIGHDPTGVIYHGNLCAGDTRVSACLPYTRA